MIGVGSKVVYVGGAPSPVPKELYNTYSYPKGYPQKGQIYVVDGFRPWKNLLGLIIVGLPSISWAGTDTGWDSRNFRLLSHAQALSELEYRRTQEVEAV